MDPEKADIVYSLAVKPVEALVLALLEMGIGETIVRDALELALEKGLREYTLLQEKSNAGH